MAEVGSPPHTKPWCHPATPGGRVRVTCERAASFRPRQPAFIGAGSPTSGISHLAISRRWLPRRSHSQRLTSARCPAGQFRYAEQIHPETTKTSTMTNTRSRLQNLTIAPPTVPFPGNLDASRGAAQLGIASQVWVHHDVVDTYRELDPGVGRNVVGAVLAVLGSGPSPAEDRSRDPTSCPCACGDARMAKMEVDLLVRRLRNSGRECLAITATGEQSAEL